VLGGLEGFGVRAGLGVLEVLDEVPGGVEAVDGSAVGDSVAVLEAVTVDPSARRSRGNRPAVDDRAVRVSS
jgi:hypothetical protein